MKTIVIVLTFITAVFAIVVIRNEMIAKRAEKLLNELTWDEHTRQEFINGCEKRSAEKNYDVPAEKIKAYCNCMYGKVSAKYSPKDYYMTNSDSLNALSKICEAETGMK